MDPRPLGRIHFVAVAAFAAAFTGLAALAQPRAMPEVSGDLLLTGSSTMGPLVIDIAKRFSARHPRVKIEVQGGGSGRGIDDARAGKASIGMASRALGEKERDLRGYSVGRDGIAVIVNKANPVTDLSEAQVRAVLTGRISDWGRIGGRPGPIVFIGRTPGRGSTEVITHFLKVKEEQLQPLRSAGENKDLIAAVATEPAAIAYMSVGEAEGDALAGAPIRLLRIDGVAASAASIGRGDYAISRPLILVTRSAPAGAARAFIDFAISPSVADLVRKHDFIPYED